MGREQLLWKKKIFQDSKKRLKICFSFD